MDYSKTVNDFSNKIKDIIYNLSLTNNENLEIVGSIAQSYQLYASDFDLIETINDNSSKYIKKFQQVIKHFLKQKNVFIGDIKSGEIKEWKILDDVYIKNNKIINYNYKSSINKINILHQNNIITYKEYNDSLNLLKQNISIKDFFKMKDLFKFHIVRWKPYEVLQGYKILRDNSKYTLKESFKSGITKLDLIAYIDNRFIEFSIIYNFNNNTSDIIEGLKTDILNFYLDKNYFKMSKRIFSLSKIYDDKSIINALSTLFNSDLGKIYLLNADIKTLLYLFENVDNLPLIRIRKEISSFNKRLNNIKLSFNANNTINKIITQIKNIEKDMTVDKVDDLISISKSLENILMTETKKFLELYQILPLDERFLI